MCLCGVSVQSGDKCQKKKTRLFVTVFFSQYVSLPWTETERGKESQFGGAQESAQGHASRRARPAGGRAQGIGSWQEHGDKSAGAKNRRTSHSQRGKKEEGWLFPFQ